jgi:hypothetical protein
MSLLFIIFIALQSSLLLIMALHDWIEIKPLTDIRALEQHHTFQGRLLASTIYAILVLIPLTLTLWYQPTIPVSALWCITSIYGLLTIGTIASWWIPYLLGSSEKHKADFAEYRNTHAFLPARGDNVIPNTLHCVMHLQVWLCFTIGLYLLMQ